MTKKLPYLFVVIFLLLTFIQFKLFYNTYNLKQDELHQEIKKSIQIIKQKIEKQETERHKNLFEKYKEENLCGPTYSNKNLDLTFRITPTDTFTNLKDLTDIISKKLTNQALQSGKYMLESLPLDTAAIENVAKDELLKLSNSLNISVQLSGDSNQLGFPYQYKTILFDDYRLYQPIYLLLNISGLSKILINQLILMLVMCLLTMIMLFIVTRYSYLSIIKFKKLSDDKAEFINHLAHEIKTPLSSIYVSSQALKDKRIVNTKNTIEHYAEIIFLESEKLNKQLENVLSISAAEKNFLNLHFDEINVHELIIQVSELFSKRIQVNHGKINLNLNASNCLIKLDTIHFGNVLYNLFDNAIKYSAANAIELIIETSNIENGIVISISDKGCGISEADQLKIFNLFYKKENKSKGFGVGLHYAKKILEFHKGSILVNSKPGFGTTFKLMLPYE